MHSQLPPVPFSILCPLSFFLVSSFLADWKLHIKFRSVDYWLQLEVYHGKLPFLSCFRNPTRQLLSFLMRYRHPGLRGWYIFFFFLLLLLFTSHIIWNHTFAFFKVPQYGSSWAGLSSTVYLKAMPFIKAKIYALTNHLDIISWVSFFHQRHICSSIVCNLYAFWKFLLLCLWSLEPSFPHITVFFSSRFASRCISLRRCYDRRGYCSRGWRLDTAWLRRCTMSSCSN